MKKLKSGLTSAAVSFLLLVSSAHAAPVIIDFEDVSGGGGPGTSMLASQGMILDWAVLSPSVPLVTTLGAAGGGGNELLFCGWCESTNGTSLYAANGTAFALDSFLLGSNIGASGLPYSGTVTGYLEAGGSVSQSISVALGTAALISFDSSWSGLASVDIVMNTSVDGHEPFEAFALDDIAVDVVPIPAAVWLFISGLGALGFYRRN